MTIRGRSGLHPAIAGLRARVSVPLLLAGLLTVAGSARAQYSPSQYSPWQYSPLQCVPFARALSSVAIFGDAWHWWDSAAGRYDRGRAPQAGAVLSFRANLRMPLGHVAVVTRVLGRRLIEIDHANWSFPGAITRSVEVVDVSDNNDWTAVRVELGKSDYFGSVYATDGFIYGKPVELGPQIIDVAQALRAAAKTPYVIHVAEALQRDNHPQIIDVAEYLRTRRAGESASLPRGTAVVRLTSVGR